MAMIETPAFVEWPKIPRLRRPVIVTEKIDGTNASVYVPEDPALPLLAGSRTRWITPEDDNYGFAAWVRDHTEELRQLGPGTHYGEWWGQGIQRKYGLSEKRFSLFNVSRWGESRPACCHVVPTLAKFDVFNTSDVEYALLQLQEHGSQAAPGFMRPEGVVVFHAASGYLFKRTIEKDEEPKGKAGKA